jgi:hypothetical protein
MAHFAQINSDSIVTQVIVVGNDDCLDSDGNESEAVGVAFCKSLLGSDTNWVQTSYNDNIRFRYAGIGMYYDSLRDAFYPKKPYPSWVMDEDEKQYVAPVDLPSDSLTYNYTWSEDRTDWVKDA